MLDILEQRQTQPRRDGSGDGRISSSAPALTTGEEPSEEPSESSLENAAEYAAVAAAAAPATPSPVSSPSPRPQALAVTPTKQPRTSGYTGCRGERGPAGATTAVGGGGGAGGGGSKKERDLEDLELEEVVGDGEENAEQMAAVTRHHLAVVIHAQVIFGICNVAFFVLSFTLAQVCRILYAVWRVLWCHFTLRYFECALFWRVLRCSFMRRQVFRVCLVCVVTRRGF